ncbi:MAG: hypothetical protein MUE56_03135, partial [Ignavibacteria bacterium]|nr:hypothetical protein [Ignavibacteria bacterium]
MTFGKISAYFISILLLTVLFSSRGLSQDEGASVYRIASISVKGNKAYDSKTIVVYSGLKENMEIAIPSDETREAIKRLWRLALFSDIKIYIDRKFGRDVYLIIEVEELPRIESIEIRGNDHFSESDVMEKIGITKGEVISEQRLKDIEYNLVKYYEEDGFALATVKTDKLISAGNEARIRIKIDEGNKLSVINISFEGNKNIPSSDLEGAMENISEKVWWKFWDGARY